MFLFRAFAFSAFTLFAAATAHAENLEFCYGSYPPYTFGENGAPTGGLKVDLLEQVVSRIDGVTATVKLLPWRRCQQEVRAGRLDGILPLFPNDDRKTYMAFSEDSLEEPAVFWYNRETYPDGIPWDGDYSEITHLSLGMTLGSFLDKDMEQAFTDNGKVVRVEGFSALFLMLQHGRVDLVASNEAVGQYTAAKLDIAQLVSRIDRPISGRSTQFGLSRLTGADKHLPAFNRALREMRDEGVILQIQKGAATQ